MKALIYQGKGQCGLEDRPKPKIQDPSDAIVKGMAHLVAHNSVNPQMTDLSRSGIYHNLRYRHAYLAW